MKKILTALVSRETLREFFAWLGAALFFVVLAEVMIKIYHLIF